MIVDVQKYIDAVCVLAGVENLAELKRNIDTVYGNTGSVPKYLLIPQIEILGVKIKIDEDILKPCLQTKGHHRVDL